MQHRTALMALAATALIVGACSDQVGSRLSTEPGDTSPPLRYVTTQSAAIVNPKTHRLEIVMGGTAPNGVRASIAGGTVTNSAIQVRASDPGIAPAGGRTIWTFTDDAKRVQKIVLLYRPGGGPPAAMQHYTDGALVSTSAYTWGKTASGWVRTRSFVQSVRRGALVGTYTTTTVPAKSGGPPQTVRREGGPSVSPLGRTLGSLAYAMAFAFAPQDATAQGFYFYACRQQWLHYAVAAAVLSGAAATLAAAPEFTPVIVTGFIAALGTAAAMEDLLISCMIANDSVSRGDFTPVGGPSGFGSGAGAGGGAGADCLEGSYAAHCTTAFTL